LFHPVVVDQLQPHPVPALQRGHPHLDGVGAVADHHRDVGQAGGGQVSQDDIQDGAVVGHRQQRLRDLLGVGQQPAARPRRKHESDHGSPTSAGYRSAAA
jgi:hypothetical protein